MNDPVADALRRAADTKEAKQAEYGDGYLQFGRIMNLLFPDGLVITPGDEKAWTRLGLYSMIMHKAIRQAHALSDPRAISRIDHSLDGMVYFAMLHTVLSGDHKPEDIPPPAPRPMRASDDDDLPF